MPKSKTIYECIECGREHPKWNGQCAGCGAWNTLEEHTPSAVFAAQRSSAVTAVTVQKLDDINCADDVRIDTGTRELNRVLGGGLVLGSVVLLRA
jgi:DNA repair protein RadA/Sms